MASYQLESETFQYAMDLHNRRIDAAIIVGAEYCETRNIACSGLTPLHLMHNPLKDKLLTYGTIGTKYKNTTTSIGCCAEVNASNPIFISNPRMNLTDIELSTAYRPRTMQRRNKCYVCTDIFIRKWLTV